MKKLFSLLTMLAISAGAFAAEKSTTCNYDVKGMTCPSCEATLKVRVKKLDGIITVKASNAKSNATVSFDPQKTSSEKIKAAIEKIGYEAKLKQCKVAS